MLEINQERIDIKGLVGHWLDLMDGDEPNGWLAWLQLLAHARHEPAFASVIRQRYARFRQVFTSVQEKGQSQDLIRSDITADLLTDKASAITSCRGEAYLKAQLSTFKHGQRQAPTQAMSAMASTPTAEEIRATAHFLTGQAPSQGSQ